MGLFVWCPNILNSSSDNLRSLWFNPVLFVAYSCRKVAKSKLFLYQLKYKLQQLTEDLLMYFWWMPGEEPLVWPQTICVQRMVIGPEPVRWVASMLITELARHLWVHCTRKKNRFWSWYLCWNKGHVLLLPEICKTHFGLSGNKAVVYRERKEEKLHQSKLCMWRSCTAVPQQICGCGEVIECLAQVRSLTRTLICKKSHSYISLPYLRSSVLKTSDVIFFKHLCPYRFSWSSWLCAQILFLCTPTTILPPLIGSYYCRSVCVAEVCLCVKPLPLDVCTRYSVYVWQAYFIGYTLSGKIVLTVLWRWTWPLTWDDHFWGWCFTTTPTVYVSLKHCVHRVYILCVGLQYGFSSNQAVCLSDLTYPLKWQNLSSFACCSKNPHIM